MFGIDDAIIGTVAGGIINNMFADDRQEDSQSFAYDQQLQAQQFNSAEAATNRAFQSDQALRAMTFNETQRETQYQTAVDDLRAAGLNPMLAFTQHGAGTTGSSAGGGSQASISPSSAGIASPGNNFDFPAAMHTASQIRVQTEQAENINADTDRKRAETAEIEARTPTHAVTIEQMKQNIEQSKSQILKIIQETSTSAWSAANIAQQTINLQEVIPQIRATVDNLKAHTKLAGAQTTLAGAQTGLAAAHTVQSQATTQLTGAQTQETGQRIAANLPALERALKELERQQQVMSMPGHQQNEAVQDSFIGSLSATMKALNPFVNIMPTIGIRGTGAPAPTRDARKDWKK